MAYHFALNYNFFFILLQSSTEEGVMGGECESSSPQLQHQVNEGTPTLPNGKKTKGRVKIKMEYIGNKLRRYTTFSKRKTGIMKKAYELSTLTGTQVMLLVASETGHVYTFATKKLRPMISSEAGKTLIRNCLNTPDIDDAVDPIGARQEFTFEPQPNISRKRKLNEVFKIASNKSYDEHMPSILAHLPIIRKNFSHLLASSI
ncbi:unnamed protein product [Brugia pahangi]|uniref:Serum response factor homolog n=1 Tax=Brugia pahangi TaxID=6280 RepID=A0A0N4TR54_BRUPA|nr:unnamed protein product [Brugia pahangi]